MDEVRREERELLETQSVPLRNYLMKHIMPTLTGALRDCVTVRPDDPIDFLVSQFPVPLRLYQAQLTSWANLLWKL